MSRSGTSGPASPSQPRLGPAWRSTSSGGRGFQPPSAALETTGIESKISNRNSFSLLDDDDGGAKKSEQNSRSSRMVSSPKRTYASRSEGFRSTGPGSGGFSSRSATKGGASGRSLADLVSRFPSSETTGRSASGIGRSHRSSSGDDGSNHARSLGSKDFVDDKKIIRFTRERLLSMRPRTDPNASRPDVLAALEGTSLLSKQPLDPVCWDNFDAEEIWNQAKERRAGKNQSTGIPARRDNEPIRNARNGGGDSWKRGVALPSGEGGSRRRFESDDPDDLWDDPMSLNEAAADFSAFGGSLDDVPKSAGGETFDLIMMAEATKKFDDEVRGDASNGENGHNHAINPTRPLASAGTTIRSGSGENVNVFEDFDAPIPESGVNDDPIRSGDDAQTASSRLMQMIGVSSTDDKTSSNVAGDSEELGSKVEPAESNMFSAFGASSVPSNPWGAPMPESSSQQSVGRSGGLDLSAKLREVRLAEEQDSELDIMRKQEEEEENRRVAMLAQQQAEAQARQAALQKQQPQQPEYSQVELILTERISTILDNSWGRSDLMTILQTLHNDDNRVIPLLGTVDALRALIVRHPRRFALTKDPTFGAEMAVLVMNNAQWQQQQASEDLQRRQQDDHQKMLAAKKEAETREAESRAKAEALAAENTIITDDPWYYADPQGNVQGPFGGEEMRQWLVAGYFKGDLPISQNQNGGFRALSSLFADVSIAFKPTAPSEEEKAKIAAETEAKAKAEAAARAEVEKREKAEIDAKAASAVAEAARQKEMQNNQNQSAQLKMLLGLGGSGSSQVAGVDYKESPQNTLAPAIVEDESSPVKNVDEPAPQSKPVKTKSKNKEPANVQAKEQPVQISAPPAPSPAWGGAGTTKTSSNSKSMSEIQKEEARVTAHLAKQRQSTSHSSAGGGWAGIAASGGTTAWSGTAVKDTSVHPVSSNVSTTVKQARGSHQGIKGTGKNQNTTNRSSTQQALEDFGANDKMTPALENWCKEQMKNLNGSEDLTLVAFCMTLTDSVEIKQYLTAYLGSTSQVNNFATEFISRKNGSKQQEQWETTGSSKKGRKKKGSVGK